MPHVPGLRSVYAKVGRLVYFGRMLDKVRLHAAGQLPPAYVAQLGEGADYWFDFRCCRFLGLRYEEIKARVLAGGTDDEILAWAEATGTPRSDTDCVVWNRFMAKLGWRDERSARLSDAIVRFGLTAHRIETIFDLLEYDEGRDPVAARAWETI